MVCMFDNGYDQYIFEIVDVESVQKQMKFNYARSARIGNNPFTQAVGAWEENISFTATLYYDQFFTVTFFEEMAKQKTPIWFVMLSGEALEVTVDQLSTTKTWFDFSGNPIKQEIVFTLEAYYE